MATKTIIYFGNVLYPDLDAASHRTIGDAKALRELGYNVVLIGTRQREQRPVLETKEEFAGFDIYYFNDPKTPRQWSDYLFGYDPLIEVISKQENIEAVILYNHPSISSKRIKSYCQKKGIKVYADCTEWFDPQGFSIHNIIKRLDTWYRMRCVNQKLDGVIAISSFLQDFYNKRGSKTICVPPLIDLTQDKWAFEDYTIERDAEGVKLVYVGNPGAGTKDKLALIVSALKGLHDKYTDIHFNLDIIGMNNEQFNDVFKMDMNGCDFVHFLGRKPNIEALTYIKHSDYTIFLRENNLICTAGFPTKFSESIACGTPVLTNPSSDLGKYIIDGKNGFTMDISSEDNLVASLHKALTVEKEQIRQMKQYCHKEKTFDYHSFIDEFSKMF